ncbi:AraC family transcriptional regulator [Burkholderia guangdongensis]|uniref:AraC family transcriptional regulator n=1 Tax=Burkholderia guangdongensis TaxID=1792500 RepID=UPI0015C85579|nr:AraC family transcriptional regulator [Burkholderia guangdongensis]
MAEDGVAPSLVLAGSGLDEAALGDPATRVSYRQVTIVFGNAVRLARDPAIALRAGARMRLTAYGIYGYALLSSPTHAATIDLVVKYHRAAAPVADLFHTRDGDVESFRYDVLLSQDPNDPLYRFALEFTCAAHLAMTRDLYGRAFGWSVMRIAYPAPGHASEYHRLLGCRVQFDQPANEVQLDAAWLDRRSALPDSVTHAMAREMCEQFLSGLIHASGITGQVQRMLLEQMPKRFPDIDSMAKTLAMTARTLRRRLEVEGTTYRDLLAGVRRDLAIEYLRKTRMTNEEIANRLGYSDAANFRHAFKGWTGKSPQEYRAE